MSRLPILMYHNVSENEIYSVGLTISTKKLETQFKYLSDNNYKTFHFSELESLKQSKSLPKKSVIITFDDVYVSQFELAYHLLEKYKLKASFFIPFAYVNGLDDWNTASEPIMSIEQLKALDSKVVELGLHSFAHKNYSKITPEEVQEDFIKCQEFVNQNKLNVHNILAYPYGKYPKKNPGRTVFFSILKSNAIAYALRIGNRVNKFPFKNNYEIQRIDIKGEDSLLKFKGKLKFGKLKLF
ncbi:MAG: polysaccharide deacetylase [Bacteroidetes bacterium]|nr:MAG: polysaccharide deacetylase [Bacteroidota bacterium]